MPTDDQVHVILNSAPPAETDGTSFHDSPTRDARVECSICGYVNAPLQAHRAHPLGGWERVEILDGLSGRAAIIVWVPGVTHGKGKR